MIKTKKLVFFIITAIFSFFVLLTSCPKADEAPPTPPMTNIISIQYNLYDSNGYKALFGYDTYKTPADLALDEWHHFTMNVDAGHIGYDGIGNPSLWTNIDIFRILAKTSSANKEVLIYIDNLVVTNVSNTPLSLDFNSDDSGYTWTSIGTDLSNPPNNAIADIGPEKCFTIHVTSEAEAGGTGGEMQWNITATDMSSQLYTVSFDYYIEGI